VKNKNLEAPYYLIFSSILYLVSLRSKEMIRLFHAPAAFTPLKQTGQNVERVLLGVVVKQNPHAPTKPRLYTRYVASFPSYHGPY
jgi:hypothetical protein